MVEGLTALGLDPRTVKYVLISHAHGDHDQGAALLQSRYGAKVVMGEADWDSTLQRAATAPGGVPKRDIAVGPGGLKLKLGDTTVDIIATPGHTPGTLSYFFPVKDGSRTLTVAYAGGTAFNFPRLAANFARYRDTQRKMAEVAEAAGATILMTNHTEFDRAYDRARIAQLPRAAGEKHAYETDTATVLRYFEMAGNCAEAQRLLTQLVRPCSSRQRCTAVRSHHEATFPRGSGDSSRRRRAAPCRGAARRTPVLACRCRQCGHHPFAG